MKSTLLLVLNLVFFAGIAQNTTTISTGENWEDVSVVYHAGNTAYENNNYNNYTRLSAAAWTASGNNTFYRTFIYFDLDEIPKGSTIQSATLYFYSDPNITSSSAYNGNSQLSGSNAFYIEKITEEWSPDYITWNRQPSTTTSGIILVRPSTSTTET